MKRLKNKYRFVIFNDNDFEEKTSFALKGTNVIAFLSILIFVAFILIFLLFAFTPLKYYIPGYSNKNTEQQVHKMAVKVDSLSEALETNEAYLKNVKNVLKGKVEDSTAVYKKNNDTAQTLASGETETELSTTIEADSLLADFNQKEQVNELNTTGQKAPMEAIEHQSFFPPLKGVITEAFNEGENHFAVDIVGPADVGIKAVKDGYVVFSGWSVATGNVIILQHQNNLISVYKHNSELLKKNGNFVNAGEPIAIIGTSGKLSTGPHLHFELWHNGKPVDPEEYIQF